MTKLIKGCYFFLLSISAVLTANLDNVPIHYSLIDDPIDVVIPTASKDIVVLNHCIRGIKENCKNVRRVIVVSPFQITDDAEWFDEKNYPFTKEEISFYINHLNYEQSLNYLNNGSRIGWYYQQLLKLYAPVVIPDISTNVLIVDADTVFFRPVEFINNTGGGQYNISTFEYHRPYFEHMDRLLPGLKRVIESYSGIVHHMLFQKPILEDLFNQVETFHQIEFWKAFCLCVDEGQPYYSGASEYEIYFNFAFTKTDQVNIRHLSWMNSGDVGNIENHSKWYDYVSYHSYMRH